MTATPEAGRSEPDLRLRRSGEFGVSEIAANTDGGIVFVDSWLAERMHVVDSGRIVIPNEDVPELERAALARGLTIDREDLRQ